MRSAVGQPYVDAIVAAGGAPLAIPLGLDEESLRRIYGTIDGLLLPGGDDVSPARYGHEPHPLLGLVDESRDELEVTLARWALADDVPILGICRGIQVLAVAAGGTLYQDLPSELESALAHDVRDFGRDYLSHDIAIEPQSRLAAVLGCATTRVNSFHHQAVRDVPAGFVVSCRSSDGVIEAIEATDRQFAVGVQCHPEGMWSTTAPHFSALFVAFVEAARNRAG
jgi:putative glutamine amidotransferase